MLKTANAGGMYVSLGAVGVKNGKCQRRGKLSEFVVNVRAKIASEFKFPAQSLFQIT